MTHHDLARVLSAHGKATAIAQGDTMNIHNTFAAPRREVRTEITIPEEEQRIAHPFVLATVVAVACALALAWLGLHL